MCPTCQRRPMIVPNPCENPIFGVGSFHNIKVILRGGRNRLLSFETLSLSHHSAEGVPNSFGNMTFRLLVILGASLVASVAVAFNPPVDTAGPLTVRIEGPGSVTQVGVPFPVQVSLENKSDAPIELSLEVGVIDRWRVEPAGPVTLNVAARATATESFTVTAGEGSYSAHYPIHAFARFSLDGKPHTAHPILVVQTKLPGEPRPRAAIAWAPLKLAPSGQVALWQLPVHRTVFEVFGEKPQTAPVGWQGTDRRTGASVHVSRQTLDGQTRIAVGMHPPWQDGRAGTLAIEFPLDLPKTTPLRLTFAQGQVPEGQSDGVTFRVRVLPLDAPEGQWGEVVFERHAVAKRWLPGEADLSRWAGQTVRLQLESHPGPKRNTGWDMSYWAEPTLVAGSPGNPAPFPPKEDEGSRVLGTLGCGGARYEVRLWPGQRGLLDTIVGFCAGGRRLYFRGFEIQVSGIRLDDPRSPILVEEITQESAEGAYQVRHRFRSVWGPFDLVGRLWVESGVLRAKLHLENVPAAQPWQAIYLEDAAAGTWSLPVDQVYAGHGNVVRQPEAFRLAFEGHRLATSFVGFDFQGGPSVVQAVDIPANELDIQPDQRHYSLHVPHGPTFTFILAENVWEGARLWHDVNGLKAAGGVAKAAGRFVFDLWGGRYGDSAAQLRRAFRYGLTDAMVIWHNWQRWGYDYRLPDIYPPNPDLGTLGEMQDLVRACKEAGVLIAVHDNYIDFYPDAGGFSYEANIAFHHSGEPVRAWLNEWRRAQSYRYRADRVEPFLRRNLRWIRDGLAPTAYFIDVWSSIGPYDYWTADGKFVDRVFTRDTWGQQFAWIRDFLGQDAPQISESGHDQLVGWLDGAQTNHLRVGKPGPGGMSWCVWNWDCADAERVPWLDAAHHDRFVLHGAGYPGRYEGGLDPRLHGIYSDDYITTEVLTGHPAMVPQAFGRDVVRKYWLLADLMRALALKRIASVEFAGAEKGDSPPDLHRQHVRWEGGGEVWVNRGPNDWDVAGVTLPEYGFLARTPSEQGQVEVAISRRDGVIVETCQKRGQSTFSLYVNGRGIVEGPRAILPSVRSFEYVGDRRFRITLRWQADDPIPAGWSPFIHFCDEEGEILFQAAHEPGIFETPQQGTLDSPVHGEIPASLPAGRTLELRVGIYHRGHGGRMWLAGADDGDRRIRLGQIHLDGAGDRIHGVRWTPLAPYDDPVRLRQNPAGKPIDFGPIVTSGACRLTRQGDAVTLTPLPWPEKDDRPAVSERASAGFDVRLRWAALGWSLPEPAFVEALAEDGRVLGREPVRREGDAIVLVCQPGVFCSRFVKP